MKSEIQNMFNNIELLIIKNKITGKESKTITWEGKQHNYVLHIIVKEEI